MNEAESAEILSRPVVFVVDDDPAILELIRRVGASLGWRVETFTTGEAFLEVIDAETAGCLILDYRLPQKSGLQLLDELHVRNVTLPVVFISGNAEVSTAVQAFRAGTVDFLEKPFDVDELRRVIERSIAQDRERRCERRRSRSIGSRINSLTPRELQVMNLVVDGSSNKQVATTLGVSPKTVEVHRANAMTKMQASSLANLVRLVINHRGSTASEG